MKRPTGSRFLIKAALKKTFHETISRLDSPTVAYQLEAEIYRANIFLIWRELGWL